MAIQSPQPDPVDDEVDRLLADPDVRKRLDAADDAIAKGTLKTVPHDQVRRRLGFDEPTNAE